MSEIVSKIKYAMSLRTPQEEALSYLDAISSHCDYKKDSKDVVEAAASEYCEKQRKVKAEFDFPSFCYAMCSATRFLRNRDRIVEKNSPILRSISEARSLASTAPQQGERPTQEGGLF